MEYHDLNEALEDLNVNQIRVDLENKKVTINNVCDGGIEAILHHMVSENWDSDDITKAVPKLANVNRATLLAAALQDEAASIADLIRAAKANVNNKPSNKLSVGDKFVASREITQITGSFVSFKDQSGKTDSILKSSFKGWAKGKTKE